MWKLGIIEVTALVPEVAKRSTLTRFGGFYCNLPMILQRLKKGAAPPSSSIELIKDLTFIMIR